MIFGSSRASIGVVIELKTLGGLLSIWEIPTVCNGIPVPECRADATDPCTAASAAALMLLPGKFVPGVVTTAGEGPCCCKPSAAALLLLPGKFVTGVVTTVEGPCCCKRSDRKGCNETDTARETSVAIWPMMPGGKADTSRPVAAGGGAGSVPGGLLPVGGLPAVRVPTGRVPARRVPTGGVVPTDRVPAGREPTGRLPAGSGPIGSVSSGTNRISRFRPDLL